MNKVELIKSYFDEILPNAGCELLYDKDYELLIAVMLSAQTTDKGVNKVTRILFKKYDTLEKLKDADVIDIENIIREIGTYKKKALFVKEMSTIIVDKYNSIMPRSRKNLESLPGVGRKTVNVVLSELGISPQFAVDTHVDRISKRLGLVKENDDVVKIEEKLKRKFERDEWVRRHHQFIHFGRYKCKAISPGCCDCKLKDICKRK